MIYCSMCGATTSATCRCLSGYPWPGTFRVEPEGPPEPIPTLTDFREMLAKFPFRQDYGEQALFLAARLMLRIDDLEKRVRALEPTPSPSQETEKKT